MRIEIGITDARGDRHVIALDCETVNEYNICKKLLRALWRQGMIWNYGATLVKKFRKGR